MGPVSIETGSRAVGASLYVWGLKPVAAGPTARSVEAGVVRGLWLRYVRWLEEGSEIGLIWGNWRSRSGQKRRWVVFQTGVRHQCFGSRCIIIPSARQKSLPSPPAQLCPLCLGALWLSILLCLLYLLYFHHAPSSPPTPTPAAAMSNDQHRSAIPAGTASASHMMKVTKRGRPFLKVRALLPCPRPRSSRSRTPSTSLRP